ncbi:hypothetical protein [Naasia aerilata]|nr:hypothetical protein [Naasia aerilata]
MSSSAGRARVLRPASAGIAFWLGVAIAAWAVFDAARVGPAAGVRWGAIAVLVLWVLWVLLWRPSIRLRDDELVVVNAMRTWTIPWSRVRSVESRLQYVFVLDDGRAVTAWGSPALSRSRGAPGSGVDLQPLVSAPAPTAEPAPILRRAAWWSLAIPAVAAVCLVAESVVSATASGL